MEHALRATTLTLAILALIIGGPLGLSFIAGEIWSELNFFSNNWQWLELSIFEQLFRRWFEGFIMTLVLTGVAMVAFVAFQVTTKDGDKDTTTQ